MIFIDHENLEDKVYEVIKFINKIIDVDIINRAKKLKSFLFNINFNNASRVN